MRITYSLLLLALAAPLLKAAPVTEDVIAQAREFLGGDEALDQIESIAYEADFTSGEGQTGTIKIIFQKPMQQRMEVVRGEVGEVTALNDFDAWRKVYDVKDETRWSVSLLEIPKIRELQANTWENLYFYEGIEKRRGRIENQGFEDLDGEKCAKLVFHHPKGIRFTRFFDVETGRLLMTRTHEGAEIRETGEIRVDGVLFPETITMSKNGEVVNEIHFRDVTLNKEFDESLFDVPSFAP